MSCVGCCVLLDLAFALLGSSFNLSPKTVSTEGEQMQTIICIERATGTEIGQGAGTAVGL